MKAFPTGCGRSYAHAMRVLVIDPDPARAALVAEGWKA
jgi:hypothetical protein